jgi:hypothetical protein
MRQVIVEDRSRDDVCSRREVHQCRHGRVSKAPLAATRACCNGRLDCGGIIRDTIT